MARILPIAVVGLALALYALWRGAYPDLFEGVEPPPAKTATLPAETALAPAVETPPAPAGGTAAAPGKLPEKPQLDVVRIDKDGHTVIAGKAEPGASVTIATQDETLAVVKADERGNWVALPDKPLPEGDHAVTIEATGKDGKAEVGDKTIVVSIPEGGSDQKPLVVAVPTKDFGASEVLQRPEIPPGAEEPAGIGRQPLVASTGSGPAPAGSTDEQAGATAGTPAETQVADAGPAAPAQQQAAETEETGEAATEDGQADKQVLVAGAPETPEQPQPAATSPTTPAVQQAAETNKAAPEGDRADKPVVVAKAPEQPQPAPYRLRRRPVGSK